MSEPAKLDPLLVRTIIDGFPNAPHWQSLDCKKLIQSKRSRATRTRDWSVLQDCDGKGGVYAFLFAGQSFSTPRRIKLHAPRKNKARKTILFEFVSHLELLLPDGRMVMYVGRSANLLNRVKGHFGRSKKTTLAQVRDGLKNSKTCSNRPHAVRFILKHGTLVYAVLDGPTNVANRDVIEVALWAKYMTPFNIKSER